MKPFSIDDGYENLRPATNTNGLSADHLTTLARAHTHTHTMPMAQICYIAPDSHTDHTF